jgi:hypothetical protein
MGRMVDRIKAVFDWAGTIYTLLGFFGGAAFVGGKDELKKFADKRSQRPRFLFP